jgi:hypothetical protein
MAKNKKFKYQPVIKHYNHPIRIDFDNVGIHKGRVICVRCNKFVKWASADEVRIYKEMNK